MNSFKDWSNTMGPWRHDINILLHDWTIEKGDDPMKNGQLVMQEELLLSFVSIDGHVDEFSILQTEDK